MPAAFIVGIGQEIIQRSQQQRTKASARRIRRLKKFSLHDHQEKILGQVLRVRGGITAAIDEAENRTPINLAKLGEAWVDLAAGAGRTTLPNQAPARRIEGAESFVIIDARQTCHVSSVIGLRLALKHKLGQSQAFQSVLNTDRAISRRRASTRSHWSIARFSSPE